MKKRKAIFAGSFDPFTNGHLNTVERASQMFDEIIICIGTNTSKQAFFTSTEKKSLIIEATKCFDNVTVYVNDDELTVAIAKKFEASFLVRGIRNSQDFEYEKNIAFMNSQMAAEIDTVFLLADEKYSSISSSMIKEIAKFNGDISKFVPCNVREAMDKKLRKS
ncbi:pantetheine-phosphate adenylyltransferase [Vagococcus vulneris]|uniref:Phosphopantetheine adenylyltransferase n=1 Tax=Vagococcus vulneris TaxID=1977869 RepID=A0A430A158_9ENTE|nr:pantetheine-phosphate adenylyltransferase [Vagococcus vulneris]RSU00145.1 pantetheine-phosphate adenylyltransferase [Vagococcus vulneris]